MAKGRYFSTQFCLNKENIKMTWKLIGMITNRKKKSYIIIPKLLDNNRGYIDNSAVARGGAGGARAPPSFLPKR